MEVWARSLYKGFVYRTIRVTYFEDNIVLGVQWISQGDFVFLKSEFEGWKLGAEGSVKELV